MSRSKELLVVRGVVRTAPHAIQVNHQDATEEWDERKSILYVSFRLAEERREADQSMHLMFPKTDIEQWHEIRAYHPSWIILLKQHVIVGDVIAISGIPYEYQYHTANGEEKTHRFIKLEEAGAIEWLDKQYRFGTGKGE